MQVPAHLVYAHARFLCRISGARLNNRTIIHNYPKVKAPPPGSNTPPGPFSVKEMLSSARCIARVSKAYC